MKFAKLVVLIPYDPPASEPGCAAHPEDLEMFEERMADLIYDLLLPHAKDRDNPRFRVLIEDAVDADTVI